MENEDEFVQQLKRKYLKNEIYSYISDVLIAVNPYKSMGDLYDFEWIKKYQDVLIGVLPAHVFGIADEVKRNISLLKKPQSIVISGESGSGKTESSKLLLKFFFGSHSKQMAQQMVNANVLLESFGNSCTTENSNSSRFIKTIQVNLNSAGIASGIELSTFALESGRVCVGSFDNFHIFHFLANGAPEELKKRLQIEDCSFASLPKSSDSLETENMCKFTEVDQILINLGLEKERFIIYKHLAGILHLSNIEFETEHETRITELSKKHVIIAAACINVFPDELEKAILMRTIEVCGSVIESALSTFAAYKARDTLAKTLYADLFRFIVAHINQTFKVDHGTSQNASIQSISILDIAGFECFNTTNHFEQFCVNYSNEKIQHFCTQRLIIDEQNWCKSEGIKLPEIALPGNQIILDMLEDRTYGIFALLEEECRLPNPQISSFIQKIVSKHERCSAFSLCRPKKADPSYDFVIRHFGKDVRYSTENFIENNAEVHSKLLCNLVEKTRKSFSTASNSCFIVEKEKFKTFSTTFRIDLQSLISKLMQTRAHFVRCVKPNRLHVPGFFDDTIVLNQLQSSGMMAYRSLMELGYPIKIPIAELFQKLQPYLEQRHISIGSNVCCRIFLLAIGFLSEDFKFGKTEIHFRPGRKHLLDLLNVEFQKSKNDITVRFKKGFISFMRRSLFISIRFMGALMLRIRNNGQNKQMCNELDESEVLTNRGEKRKEFSQELREALPKEVKRKEATKSANEKMPSLSTRFDGIQHLPNYDRDDGRKGFRCKLEGCGKPTTVYCEKCKVHICFMPGKSSRERNCFKKFHLLEEN